MAGSAREGTSHRVRSSLIGSTRFVGRSEPTRPTRITRMHAGCFGRVAVGKLLERYSRFFFEPAPPAGLGICRLIFFSLVAALQFPLRTHEFARVPRLFYRPIWLFRVLHLPLLPQRVLILL